MNVNPMQLLRMIKGGQNPQQLVMSILQQPENNTPILKNAAALAQGNNTAGLQQLARNLAAQKGIDFDTQFGNFVNNFK